MKTQRFLEARQRLGEGAAVNDDVLFLTKPPPPPGLDGEEAGGAYMTVSAKASEQRDQRHQIPGPSQPNNS